MSTSYRRNTNDAALTVSEETRSLRGTQLFTYLLPERRSNHTIWIMDDPLRRIKKKLATEGVTIVLWGIDDPSAEQRLLFGGSANTGRCMTYVGWKVRVQVTIVHLTHANPLHGE